MLELRCESMGQHRHGIRFVDDIGSCLACKCEVQEDRIRELEEAVRVLAKEVSVSRVKDRAPEGNEPNEWMEDTHRRLRAWVDSCECTDANPIARAAVEQAGKERAE